MSTTISTTASLWPMAAVSTGLTALTRKLTTSWGSALPQESRTDRTVRSHGLTDVGHLRENNEDAFAIDNKNGTFVVADGIGGGTYGEVAARLAVRSVQELIAQGHGTRPTTRLQEAIQGAHLAIQEAIRIDSMLQDMGTTVVSLLVEGDFATVAHAGDSRAYLLRDGRLERLTRDHTVAADFVAAGRWNTAQAARHPMGHVLTRALSRREHLEVDSALIPINTGDIFLLCSDGLTGMLRDTEIEYGLGEGGDAEAMSDRLVQEALKRGGHDNVTVLIVEIL